MKGAAVLLLMALTLAFQIYHVNGAPSEADVACLKPNCCRDVTCEPLTCPPGEEEVFPPLECCPVCRPCSQITCKIPNCGSRQLVLFPGECCPCCDPHCANVHCIFQQCGENEHLATPKGECCPKCVQTCRFVCFSIPPICREDQTVEFPVGKCCQECVCNYDNLYCTIPRCKYAAGEKFIVREEESCCPMCEASETQSIVQSVVNPPPLNCPNVECNFNGLCPLGQQLVTPDGPCCPYCEHQSEKEHEIGFGPVRSLALAELILLPTDPCIGVLCLPTFCSPGEVRFTPKGQCCEICVPLKEACSLLAREREGKVCEAFLEHAQCVSSTSAQITNPCAVTLCEAGTVCEVIGGQAVCIPQFPTQECTFPMQCEPGTECRVIGGDAQACVPIDQPDSCAAVLCKKGTTCKVINGQAVCVPVSPTPECRRLCPPGTVCKFIDGNAVCVH